jgi:hypothetical protein
MRAVSSGLPLPASVRFISASALDRQRRARCALGVVFLCHRIAEQRENAVAELLGHMAAFG